MPLWWFWMQNIWRGLICFHYFRANRVTIIVALIWLNLANNATAIPKCVPSFLSLCEQSAFQSFIIVQDNWWAMEPSTPEKPYVVAWQSWVLDSLFPFASPGWKQKWIVFQSSDRLHYMVNVLCLAWWVTRTAFYVGKAAEHLRCSFCNRGYIMII